MKKLKDISGRIVATFLTSALGIIGGASLLGDISVAKSAALAGFAACAQVIERLARASLDGKLTMAEINEAFTGKANPEE
jgi:acetyl-CoA carboxylase beta subunit